MTMKLSDPEQKRFGMTMTKPMASGGCWREILGSEKPGGSNAIRPLSGALYESVVRTTFRIV